MLSSHLEPTLGTQQTYMSEDCTEGSIGSSEATDGVSGASCLDSRSEYILREVAAAEERHAQVEAAEWHNMYEGSGAQVTRAFVLR